MDTLDITGQSTILVTQGNVIMHGTQLGLSSIYHTNLYTNTITLTALTQATLYVKTPHHSKNRLSLPNTWLSLVPNSSPENTNIELLAEHKHTAIDGNVID